MDVDFELSEVVLLTLSGLAIPVLMGLGVWKMVELLGPDYLTACEAALQAYESDVMMHGEE